ncbi:MAG: ABC transporter substrate-binding protein [Lachnospiraceae bacterium]|nr:ABC transporter substrate-binding protein [Lachnospiraceae bacterium]
MKKKMMAMVLTAAMTAMVMTGCGSSAETAGSAETTAQTEAATTEAAGTETGTEAAGAAGTTYKVGIVQYVDDASLNQIQEAIQTELDAKGAELNVTFDYADYSKNGQADSTVLNQIAADLIADEVDIIVPIATPTACIMQAATEDNQIPVVFSAVSDPVGAGLAESMEAPGSNITGTSDALDTTAIMNLMMGVNPDTKKLGLLYDKGQDSSTAAIAEAKAFCEANGIEVVEKTGTTNDEISMAADALIAEGVDATFTPQDNTVMKAQLSIYEKFVEAGIPQYCGADSFALNGAFMGYGVNYAELGTLTADMVVDILVNGADPAATAIQTQDNGIATVNTETATALGLDYSMFKDSCSDVVEITTAEEFE